MDLQNGAQQLSMLPWKRIGGRHRTTLRSVGARGFQCIGLQVQEVEKTWNAFVTVDMAMDVGDGQSAPSSVMPIAKHDHGKFAPVVVKMSDEVGVTDGCSIAIGHFFDFWKLSNRIMSWDNSMTPLPPKCCCLSCFVSQALFPLQGNFGSLSVRNLLDVCP